MASSYQKPKQIECDWKEGGGCCVFDISHSTLDIDEWKKIMNKIIPMVHNTSYVLRSVYGQQNEYDTQTNHGSRESFRYPSKVLWDDLMEIQIEYAC